MPAISLCMIVCNEEDNIRRCLESARELVNEIIVVDTGSTDRTRSICEGYGARIFDYNWANDFSEARNYGISKADCEWILLLDADEELKISDPAGIKEYLQDTAYDLIPISMVHFYGNKPANEKSAHFSKGLRLVRNGGDLRFIGKIHERIDTGEKSIEKTPMGRSLIRILHYGYMEDAREKKQDRNISLLLKENDNQTDDPWLNYYIAAEYYRSGRLDEAYREINTAIVLFLGKKLKPPSLVYKLKYDMLIASRQYDVAYNGIEKAIELYPDYVDLHFYKGILQYNCGEYDKAKNTFIYCMVIGEANTEHLILAGSGSFLALYYLGRCHEKLGEIEQAAEAFRQAETLCPKLGSARQGIESFKYILDC